MARLALQSLRVDQSIIVRHEAKVKALAFGRRWGKSTTASGIVLPVAALGGRAAWIAPTFKNTRALWRMAVRAVGPLRAAGLCDVSQTERVITFPRGGQLALYSADNIDAIRGEWFHVVVVDEAPKVAEEAWTEAIMPTLADVDGDALLIGSPAGKNWFYREWVKGQQAMDHEMASWNGPTSDNPSPFIRAAFERAKTKVSERSFKQEWLAQFLDDGGAVFKYVRDACGVQLKFDPEPGHTYGIGIDWAKTVDFTVVTVIDIRTKEVVWIERFNQIDYVAQVDKVKRIVDRYKCQAVWSEENSIGAAVNDMLKRQRVPIRSFRTGGDTKRDLIEGLVVAFEQRYIKLPAMGSDLTDQLVNELEAFEITATPKGTVTYAAPQGIHDDMVISLALAWLGANRPVLPYG